MRKLEWGALIVLGGVMGTIGLSVPRGNSQAIARPAASDITDAESTLTVEAREEQVPPLPPSQPSLAAAVEEAFAKGSREGFLKGQDAGFQDGRQKGFDEGHEKGMTEGREQGTLEGFRQGAIQGYAHGHRVGFDAGFQEGLSARRDGNGQ